MVERILLQGLLEKKNESNNSWKSKTFVLKEISCKTSDFMYCLSCYELNEGDGSLKSTFLNTSNAFVLGEHQGTLQIDSETAVKYLGKGDEREIFEIEERCIGGARSMWTLAAPSKEVKDTWIRQIKELRGDQTILMQGLLEKQGRWRKSWKTRLFVLKRNGILTYYVSANLAIMKAPNKVQSYECQYRGSLSISSGSILKYGGTSCGRSIIELNVPATSSQAARTLLLSAGCPETKAQWTKAFKTIADSGGNTENGHTEPPSAESKKRKASRGRSDDQAMAINDGGKQDRKNRTKIVDPKRKQACVRDEAREDGLEVATQYREALSPESVVKMEPQVCDGPCISNPSNRGAAAAAESFASRLVYWADGGGGK